MAAAAFLVVNAALPPFVICSRLSDELRGAKADLLKAQSRAADYESQVSQRDKTTESLRQQVEEVMNERSEGRQKLRAVEAQLSELRLKLMEAEAQTEHSEGQMERLKREKEQAVEARFAAMKDVQAVKDELLTLQAAKGEAEGQRIATEDEVRSLRSKNRDLQEKVSLCFEYVLARLAVTHCAPL